MSVDLYMRAETLSRTRSVRRAPYRGDVSISIPVMGGDSLPNTTTIEEVADWIQARDKLPLLLALSLYTSPVIEYGGFKFQPDWGDAPRIGVWYREETDDWVVGCRGTAIGQEGGGQDLEDDKKIGFGSYCDLSLVESAIPVIQNILDQEFLASDIVIAGHSLGGAATICLSARFGIRGISLNGGASPTNPVLFGPGPTLATHYHVFGDLISTHMSEQAAHVVRVKGSETNFGSFYPHAAIRILKSDGPKQVVSASEEDDAYYRWGTAMPIGIKIFGRLFNAAVYLAQLKRSDITRKSPIPDSSRYELMKLNGQLK